MQSTKERKALGYRRVSGKTQKDNFSLQTQDARIRGYIDSLGIFLVAMLTDVGSGLSVKQRPNFVKLIDYALDPRNGITDVVFHVLDRYTRNILDFHVLTQKLLDAGITIHFARDAEVYDYKTANKYEERLFHASRESRATSERTKEGQRTATMLGLHIGPPPWGYRLLHDSEFRNENGEPFQCGRLEPDPETWHHCLKLWSMAKDGSTPMRIAIYNRLHNVPSPSGEDWTDGCVRYILKNPKYHGQLFRGVNPQSIIPGPKENAPPIIIENRHDAAVDYKDWLKVNKGIKSRHRSQGPTRSHTSPNPLSNKLKCGYCAVQGQNSNLELTGNKNDVRRLRCSWKKDHGRDTCVFTGARLDSVLVAVSDRLRNHYLTEDTLESIIDGVAEMSREYLEEQETSKSGISDRLKVVKGKIESGNEALLEARKRRKNLNSLIDEVDELEREKAELEKMLEGIAEATEEALLYVNDREGIIETVMSRKMFTDPEDPEAVRDLIDIFIERVELFQDGHGVIYYHLPVRSERPEGIPAKETIHFEKRNAKGPVAIQSCVLEHSTGLG